MRKKPTEFNLESEIASCAAYLLRNQETAVWLNRSFYSPENFKAKLDSLERKLADAVRALIAITDEFEFGQMDRYSHCDARLRQSLSDAQDAWSAVRISKHEVAMEHSRTRAQEMQRSAVKLAYSMVGNISQRQVRGVAVRIMTRAGIESPDASSITNWLKEIRNESSNVK